MLQSLDGKISTGASEARDIDKDFPLLEGVREGLSQYYALEQTTDLCSLNSGRVLAKVGANEKEWNSDKPSPIRFVIIDNKPHLNAKGCLYFAQRSSNCVVITTNSQHPMFQLLDTHPGIRVLKYEELNFTHIFQDLLELGIEKMTIQTGSSLNATFLRAGLIDEISLVVAPVLIGGNDTASLIGGASLQSDADLRQIRTLTLKSVEELHHSYLHLRYLVRNQ